ncbi:MAG: hypothetical protein ACI80S_001461 [Pseudohongiellaceae bacterium]|jgi:hypothetical protein
MKILYSYLGTQFESIFVKKCIQRLSFYRTCSLVELRTGEGAVVIDFNKIVELYSALVLFLMR